MPFFIKSVITDARPRVFPVLERLVFGVAAGLLIVDLVQPFGRVAGGLALALGLLQLARLIGWHDRRIWTTPMLTVLYVGLLWLALGLILDGLPAFTGMTPRGALHALTVGAIGVVTLGMMARVAVGHTGRAMQAAPLTLLAFVLINLAAVLARTRAPARPRRLSDLADGSAGFCWILAFGLFLWVHAPMLIEPAAGWPAGLRHPGADSPSRDTQTLACTESTYQPHRLPKENHMGEHFTEQAFLPLKIAILTVSDSRGEDQDTSGHFLRESAETAGHPVVAKAIVPDDRYQLRAVVSRWIADPEVNVVLSTGGTGVTGRDSTPEAIRPLFDKEIEGFGELFRQLSFAEIGASTIQSRAIAGLANGTFVFCLPGSTGACRTAWEQILRPQLDIRTRPCNFAQLIPRLRER